MTEEIAATPGWVEQRLQAIFEGLPAETRGAREAYALCIAGSKAAAAPSDLLGAEFIRCREALRRALLAAGLDEASLRRLEGGLATLEAEIDANA